MFVHGGGKVDEDDPPPDHDHKLKEEGEDGEEDAAHDAADRLGGLGDESDGNSEPASEEDRDEKNDGAETDADDKKS